MRTKQKIDGDEDARSHTDPRGRRWACVLPLLSVLLLAGCGDAYPQSSVSPNSDFAEVIHSLYTSIFWWTMLIGGVVWGLLGYILVRFRERPDAPRPKPNHGNLGLEIGWTVGPALIVVAIAIPTIQAVFATQPSAEEEAGALLVDVVGHQFWWEFSYPESGVVTANELHLPVDTPVRLRLRSADVIHSFWVPQLGGKRDVNPRVNTPEGEDPRYTWISLTPTETGVFMGQCAEFCGDSHSLMATRVVVESREEFEAWQDAWSDPEQPAVRPTLGSDQGAPEAAPDPQLAERGRQVFFEESYCVLCHAVSGTAAAGNLGPNLTNFGARMTLGAGIMANTPDNLVEWIRNPGAIKPGVNMPGARTPAPREGGGEWQPTNLDDEQLRAVAAYLSTLGVE